MREINLQFVYLNELFTVVYELQLAGHGGHWISYIHV